MLDQGVDIADVIEGAKFVALVAKSPAGRLADALGCDQDHPGCWGELIEPGLRGESGTVAVETMQQDQQGGGFGDRLGKPGLVGALARWPFE